MNITQRSTSPLMKIIFGNDLEIIKEKYNGYISSLYNEHEELQDIFLESTNRTGFLLSYMSVEYGYHTITDKYLPDNMRDVITGFGLIGLAVSIDDDVADEYAYSNLKMVKNLSVSEIIQHFAYSLIWENDEKEISYIVMDKIKNALKDVGKYQTKDAQNKDIFRYSGFNLRDYLDGTFKTVCPIKYGFRLGIALSRCKSSKMIESADRLAECLGVCLQLIDDIMDLQDDIKVYSYPVTFPSYVYIKKGTVKNVLSLIDEILYQAKNVLKVFPYPEKFRKMLEGYSRVKEFIERKIEEGEIETIIKSRF